jgi:hypothetical protein
MEFSLPSLEPDVLRKLISYACRTCLDATTVPAWSSRRYFSADVGIALHSTYYSSLNIIPTPDSTYSYMCTRFAREQP